jgi:hypothetical protein
MKIDLSHQDRSIIANHLRKGAQEAFVRARDSEGYVRAEWESERIDLLALAERVSEPSNPKEPIRITGSPDIEELPEVSQ